MLDIWLTRDDAVMPSKAHPTDVGFDLTLVAEHKRMPHGGAIMYDTGVRVTPPEGFYVEVVPRSSLSKTGWIMANSVGVIDPTYTGNIYVVVAPLMALPEALPLQLPFTGFQMIVRKSHEAVEARLVTDRVQTSTSRAAGGFGSTTLYQDNNVNQYTLPSE